MRWLQSSSSIIGTTIPGIGWNNSWIRRKVLHLKGRPRSMKIPLIHSTHQFSNRLLATTIQATIPRSGLFSELWSSLRTPFRYQLSPRSSIFALRMCYPSSYRCTRSLFLRRTSIIPFDLSTSPFATSFSTQPGAPTQDFFSNPLINTRNFWSAALS